MTLRRTFSFLLITAMYGAAMAVSLLAARMFPSGHPLMAAFWTDIVATLVIWLFGILCKNSSTYDPYWSVAPLAILAVWWIEAGYPTKPSAILFMAGILLWGLRLTFNWAIRWQGMGHEDWRYRMYRAKMPRLWFLTNLFGINLMPTVLVFLGMIPVYNGLHAPQTMTLLTWLGFLVTLLAISLEFFADSQMEAYKRDPGRKEHIDLGLWHVSRHPNYLGEVLFWWGLWIMQWSLLPSLWITIVGPVLITLLFVCISIPMMEEHILVSRPSYTAYQKDVPMLIPSLRRMLHERKASS